MDVLPKEKLKEKEEKQKNKKSLLHSSYRSPWYVIPEMLLGNPYQGITTDIIIPFFIGGEIRKKIPSPTKNFENRINYG